MEEAGGVVALAAASSAGSADADAGAGAGAAVRSSSNNNNSIVGPHQKTMTTMTTTTMTNMTTTTTMRRKTSGIARLRLGGDRRGTIDDDDMAPVYFSSGPLLPSLYRAFHLIILFISLQIYFFWVATWVCI